MACSVSGLRIGLLHHHGNPPSAARAAFEIWLSSSDSSGQAADWLAPLEKGRLMPIHQITGLYHGSYHPFIDGIPQIYIIMNSQLVNETNARWKGLFIWPCQIFVTMSVTIQVSFGIYIVTEYHHF